MTDTGSPTGGAVDDVTAAAVLAALGHAVIVTDVDGVIHFWNDAAEHLYGYRADEVAGRPITDVTVPEVTQDVAADIMASLRAGIPWSGVFAVRRRDGSPFHALVTDSVLYRDGQPVGIVGVSADLGSALGPLLERSTDAALLLNRAGEATYVSPAAQPLFGWRVHDVLGSGVARLVHPDDRELFRSASAARGDRHVIEVRVQGAEGWVLTEVTLTNRLDDPLVRAVVCNLHYSDRLAQLSERQRISERLHVDILQTLFSAVLDLETTMPDVEPRLRPRLAHALEAVGDAITALRAVVSN